MAAEPAVTRDLIRRVQDWPAWWPSSLSVEAAPPRVAGATEASRYTFQTRLPYRMAFQADVVQHQSMSVQTVVVGRVEGIGSWEVGPVPGGSRVHFEWSVDPQALWMRAVSPLARPVFIWNHQAIMAEGARAAADRLGVEMLRPPACTPSLGAAGFQLLAGVSLVFALTQLVRQARYSCRHRRRHPPDTA